MYARIKQFTSLRIQREPINNEKTPLAPPPPPNEKQPPLLWWNMIKRGGGGVNWWPWRVSLSLPLTDQGNRQDHYPWYQWPLHPYSTQFITSGLKWIANWCVKTHVIALKSTLRRALRGGFRGEGGRACSSCRPPPLPRVCALSCALRRRMPIGPAALGQASLGSSGPCHRLPSKR